MPLSEHEQRILAEIERRLLEEDPKFAHQVGSSFQLHLARRLKLAVAGFVLGLIIVAVGVGFVQSAALGVAGFVIMLLAVFEFVRVLRRRAAVNRPAGSSGSTPPSAPAKNPIESWWTRMTERWRHHWEERGGSPPP